MRQWTPRQVAVPAGTTQAAPVTVSWSVYPGWVHQWQIDIPAGHSGLTGIRLVYMGTPIVPFSLNDWLIASGRTFTIPYDDQVEVNGLQIQAFNTDIYNHTFYLYADVDPYFGPHGAWSKGTPVHSPATASTSLAVATLTG